MMGCAGAPRALSDLEAQVRQLRAEQERQARQIELLEQRVVLAEDTVRQMRREARVRPTIRIAPEESTPSDEPIPSAAITPSDNTEYETSEPSVEPRPTVRAVGRQGPPPSTNPIVVREEDRLPVVPVPPQLEPPPRGNRAHPPASLGPREQGPDSALPDSVPAANPHRVPPGVSSARDPRAAPAYDQALSLARSGRCTEAIELFSAFLVRWPDHPFADNAMYWRGECLLARGEVRRAAHEFEGLLARFPVGNKVPDALYKLVICYRRLGDETRARTYAEQLLHNHPHSELAARLRSETNP